MCSICGFIHNKKLDKTSLIRMNQVLKYRGPDDEGYYLKNIENTDIQVGLAHNRLSILDLSSLGHQPMESRDGTIVVCFNGEIYNYLEIRKELQKKSYIFQSECDTEVIIYAYMEWGISCIEKFNGMFAIALWDKVANAFYLVRDRMGVKPVYYYYENQNFVFASELKSIMEYPFFKKELDETSLSEYLHYQYITGPNTIFKNTYKLEPGSILCLSKEGIEISEYWSIQKAYINRETVTDNYQTAKKQLKELLLTATDFRMISDVPLGGFLSGGYDSTLIVSLMRELSTHAVKTFTIGFFESGYDEATYAEAISKQLGTEHYCKYLSMNEGKQILKDIPLYFDEPMADPSLIASMLLAKETKKHVTVVLSGDAGDELFCGYNKYSRYNKLLKLKTLSKMLNDINSLINLKDFFVKRNARKLLKLFYADNPENAINADYYTYRDRNRDLFPFMGHSNKYTEAGKLTDEINMKYMLTDMVTYLPDDVLAKVDRATMSASLEARAPFLDYRVVEYALSLPIEYKFRDGNKKRILKDIAYDYVDRNLLDRPKQGFGVPVYEWLYKDFKGMTGNLLEEGYLKRQGIFHPGSIRRMTENFQTKYNLDIGRIIWNILVFQMWWVRYMENS